ncbi:MAG TPA: hypothetical protein VK031_09300, partial [Tissierellaceae bacterium]|nr:hypothetical protein [Tissierellaceae bacterium]
MKNKKIIYSLIAIIIVAGALYLAFNKNDKDTQYGIVDKGVEIALEEKSPDFILQDLKKNDVRLS